MPMDPVFEKLKPLRMSFTAYLREEPSFPFRWHYHPEYELVAVFRDEGERFVGDVVEGYRDGDLVLLGPNIPHTWASRKPAGARWRSRAAVVQFGHGFLGESFFAAPEFERIRELLAAASGGLQFQGRTRDEAFRLLRTMLRQDGPRRLLCLLQLLDLLSRSRDRREIASRVDRQAPDAEGRKLIERIFRVVEERYRQPLRIGEMARLAHMSESSFCRFFRKFTGKSFVCLLVEMRIAMACKMLIETDKPVTAICHECGFQNLSNFNRQFLRLKQCSPRHYRRQWLEGARE